MSAAHQPQQALSQNIKFGINAPAAPYTTSSASSKTIHISSSSKPVESVGPSQSMIADSEDLFMGQASPSNEIEALLNEDVYGRTNQGNWVDSHYLTG